MGGDTERGATPDGSDRRVATGGATERSVAGGTLDASRTPSAADGGGAGGDAGVEVITAPESNTSKA